ncbi:MAG: rhombosortase [Pseudomonadota bacterium]|nr:rhombosortase [Pseudomonadota bacterium]
MTWRIAPRAWLLVAGVLAAGSLLVWLLPSPWLDWQPRLAVAQPWRCVTAAFVHWSPQHLGANLLGVAVVAALGVAAALPVRAAVAWATAWPLTQLGLLLQPDLLHYGGASGVLHAGVAVAALWLVVRGRRLERWIGVAVGVGLIAKVVLEHPFGPPLRTVAGWDIAIAPLAHATGTVAGLLCAAVVLIVPGSSSKQH